MRLLRPVVLILLSTVACERFVPRPPTPQPADLGSRFSDITRAHLASDSVPGAFYVVVGLNGTSFSGTAGLSDIERGIPVSDTTLFNIASVSKPLTALLVMGLVDGGKLSLDEPVMNLVRGWTPPPGFDSAGVTVRRILSHSAGLGMPSVPCPPLDSARPRTVDALRGTFGDRGPLTVIGPPGEHFAYSGGGYTLLQLGLESRFAMPIDTLLDRWLFRTLGRPYESTDPRTGAPRAVPYGEDRKPLRAYRCVGEVAGGVYLSAHDAERILSAYVGRSFGVLGGGADVDSVAVPRVRVEIPGVDVGGASYGFGHFVVQNASGDTIIFHSGGNPGAVAYLAVNRTRRTAIFVAANSERGIALVRHLVAEWGRIGGFAPPPVF